MNELSKQLRIVTKDINLSDIKVAIVAKAADELERQAAALTLTIQLADDYKSDYLRIHKDKIDLLEKNIALTARAEKAEARNLAWDKQPVVAYEYSSGAGREEGRPATLSHKFHASDEDMSEFELIVTKLIVKLEPIT